MERIDFIDAYCDSWCERCAFTMRCAGFDRHVAIAMCDGDVEQALELALSRPDPGRVEGTPPPDWLVELTEHQPAANELEELARKLEARDERVRATALSKASHDYSEAVHRWLTMKDVRLRAAADAIVVDSLDIVGWDNSLIAAKLHRSLSGREDIRDGDDADESPVQNDWNGSAKVAMISLARSVEAWRVIAAATSDSGARALVDQAVRLLAIAREEFPRAMEFVRPGFDEPWR